MSGIERYFRDSGYLHERLGNALSYLKDPREFFWKQKAKKEAAALIQEPELAALQREAKELLKDDSRSIEEIANAVGYHDYFYFTKVFKKTQGISPSKYRKSL